MWLPTLRPASSGPPVSVLQCTNSIGSTPIWRWTVPSTSPSRPTPRHKRSSSILLAHGLLQVDHVRRSPRPGVNRNVASLAIGPLPLPAFCGQKCPVDQVGCQVLAELGRNMGQGGSPDPFGRRVQRLRWRPPSTSHAETHHKQYVSFFFLLLLLLLLDLHDRCGACRRPVAVRALRAERRAKQLRDRLLGRRHRVPRHDQAAVLAAVDHLVLAGSPALRLEPARTGACRRRGSARRLAPRPPPG